MRTCPDYPSHLPRLVRACRNSSSPARAQHRLVLVPDMHPMSVFAWPPKSQKKSRRTLMAHPYRGALLLSVSIVHPPFLCSVLLCPPSDGGVFSPALCPALEHYMRVLLYPVSRRYRLCLKSSKWCVKHTAVVLLFACRSSSGPAPDTLLPFTLYVCLVSTHTHSCTRAAGVK